MKKHIIHIVFCLLAFALIINVFDNKKITPSEFIVELEARVLEDDLFMVYYLPEGVKSFSDKQSSFIRIKGGSDIQKIQISIPADKPIQKIRIDIGRNVKQKPLEIKSILLKSSSASFLYKKDLMKLFKPNYFIEVKNGLVHTKTVKGRYDPFISPTPVVLKDLIKLRKEYYPIPIWVPYLIGIIFSFSIFLSLFHQSNNSQKFSLEKTYISIFICLLVTPSIVKLFDTERKDKNKENRELAALPEYSLSEEFPKEFETYYNDNFGLRNELVKLSSNIKINVFRTSPRPKEVQFGKSQFLFFNKEEIFDSYTNSNIMTPKELNSYCKAIIEHRDSLASKGIKFVSGFWPNKHTIYPELLSYSMVSQIKGDISLADQMVHYFKQNNFPFFDVREDLLLAKKDKNLYCKLDTHWNNNGAYLAYRSFCSQTFLDLNLTPFSLDEFEIKSRLLKSGDLTKIMGVDEILGIKDLNETYTLKDKLKSFSRINDPKGFPPKSKITKNQNCGNKLKVLIFKDSYMTALVKFFSLHYREIIYIHGAYDEDMVHKINPDIVINCRVERHIASL